MTGEIAQLFWSQFWQLTSLIACVGLMGATVLRNRPHLVHVLWVIVFVKSLTVPLWSSPIGIFSRLQPRETIQVPPNSLYWTPAPSPNTTGSAAQRYAVVREPSGWLRGGLDSVALESRSNCLRDLGGGRYRLVVGGHSPLAGGLSLGPTNKPRGGPRSCRLRHQPG